MRSVPLRFARASRLPTPKVERALVRQVVNLRPAGNTVTIATQAENPFESRAPITVVTQASGGMARAQGSQQSKRLLHDYLPGVGGGLGADVAPVAAKAPTAIDMFTSAANTGADLYRQRQQASISQAQARQMQAQAAAEESKARRDAIAAQLSNPFAAMRNRGGIAIPLAIVGVGAAIVATVLILRKRKGGRGRRR